MDHLDDLLNRSAARPFPVDSELERVVNRVTRGGLPSRRLMIAGVVTLLLGGATAAFAGIDHQRVDTQPDGEGGAAWTTDIDSDGELWTCSGTIRILPAWAADDTDESYLATKQFFIEHGWSDLRFDEPPLHPEWPVAANDLAESIHDHTLDVVREAGLSVESISTEVIAGCVKK